MTDYKYVGKSAPRNDLLEKVTGKAKYTSDFKLPRMLVGKVLRSPYPHAKIKKIDISKAEMVSGVRAIITCEDVPKVRWSTSIEDQYVLPVDNLVRKVDDAVAAVAAETSEAAEEAIDLIEVEYDELPAVLNFDEGFCKEPKAVLHPDFDNYTIYPPMAPSYIWKPIKDRPNVIQTFKVKTGDIHCGTREAEIFVENTFEVIRGAHCAMEPHGCTCWFDEKGIINVLSTSQSIWLDRSALSRIYRCDEEKFRMHSPWVGGGFGGKYGLKEEPIAIELSRKAGGRPVKLIMSRRECFLTTETRFAMRTHIKDGFTKDGKLVTREIRMEEDCGAYAMIAGMLIKNAAFGAIGTYKIPNFNLDSIGVYTNLPRSSLLRGVGTPEVSWAIEQQMDIAAEKLGIDPLEIRIKNLLKVGDADVCGQINKSTAAKECLERVAEEIGFGERLSRDSGPWKRGRGIAIGNKYTCAGQADSVTVKIFREGIVEVRHNSCEMGQGTHQAFAQMAAEEFQIPIECVRVVRGDTNNTPYSAGSWSSRSIFHSGNALLRACADAKKKMFAIAAPIVGISADSLETKDFKIYRKYLPSQSISWSDLFVPGLPIAKEGAQIVGAGYYISPIVLEDENGHSPRMCNYYSYTAYGVEVAVNVDTGEVRVERAVGASDMGKPINPKMCEGQIEGGASMGIGLAIYEEMKFDNGLPLNASFADYKIPTVMEIPIGENMKAFLEPCPFEEGPYNAKGLGESTLSAMGPAIGNALYNAIGVRVYTSPICRERVWRAIQEKKNKRKKIIDI